MGSTAVVALTHTLFGPDHYLPFIVMAKARRWSLWKTTWLTFVCGLGHVASSVIVAIIGILTGITIAEVEIFEGVRGDLAAWAFILFGLIYMIWGIYRAIKNKPHKHRHVHSDGSIHIHEHTHDNEHDHTHNKNITPWVLFTIFVLGPCEPLILMLMKPAASLSTWGVASLVIVFTIVTLITMLTVVILAFYGFNLLPFGKLEKYTHAIAGFTVFASGMAIVFLGL